jgi:cobyrinic acid a,c-diamide synthase
VNGLLIAGTQSGVGKTTVTLAILAALRRRGRIVQACKGGPDFLDTGHHTRISGRPARNLDTWMLTPEANLDVLRHAMHGADTLVVEGMMGLFDGKDGASDTGSSAEIARLFHLPVVLVLDASKSARSIAAVVLGFESFSPALPLAGVILNRVAGERHFRTLASAIRSACRTPILGWLPRDPAIAIPERHLGLQTVEETTTDLSNTLADLAEQTLDLDAIAALQCGIDLTVPTSTVTSPTVRIGIARDQAFSFYYQDNLDLLRQHGATLVPFSPLTDPFLPPDLDALYLGGGYPELHASTLAANTSMLAAIRAFPGHIYAECGGMIYLSQSLVTQDETTHAFVGLLPSAFAMTPRLQRFGYATAELQQDCLLGPRGTVLRGHSFHYSRIASTKPHPPAYQVLYSLTGNTEPEGFVSPNILASYLHLHFRTHADIVPHLISVLRARRQAAA